ncbi:MAG: CTP synthase [Candidatus Aenigmarchaeota archaeon]|nr:CTP synthase [Candidatus Aenigmarchaeota archaeon]
MPTKKTVRTLSKKTTEHEFYTSIPKGYRVGRTKYIIIMGSVMSGVGKGTFSASLGNLLTTLHGFKVSPIKFDGYLNYDAGTLNPYRHGEVFVLDDGTECDLDLGSYERMIKKGLTKSSYLTGGKIFKDLIDKERAGKFLGRDVQFIPHVTGEIKGFLRKLAVESDADIVMVEVGGTIGDIENAYFIEAMRELAYEEGKENVCFVNVTYIIEPKSLGEQKSKAAQLGIRNLMSLGIQPNLIVCRSHNPIREKIKEKISIYSNVPVERVIGLSNMESIYHIPLNLMQKGVDKSIMEILNLKSRKNGSKEFDSWVKLTKMIESAKKTVEVGITGKYTEVHDSYISILKALEHSAPYEDAKVNVRWVETSKITVKNVSEKLKGLDGIIVPGGFGSRGAEGKIECIRYAREHDIPYFGLCLGFQMAVIEYARHICGMKKANSTEIDSNCKQDVICILPEQEEIEELGGTMRLGGHDVVVKKGTQAYKLYGKGLVRERFRHRFNVNTTCIETLEKHGMVFSGMAPKKRIMQILELPKNRFHIGVQFHPEFTSRPLEPNPLYLGFIRAMLDKKRR